jgi:hypothetical protein
MLFRFDGLPIACGVVPLAIDIEHAVGPCARDQAPDEVERVFAVTAASAKLVVPPALTFFQRTQ